jgi:hypothetical protein
MTRRPGRFGGRDIGRPVLAWGRALAAALAVLPLAARVAPLAAQTSLTIYNDGRVLVRRSLAVNLPQGASEQRLSLGPLDPATIVPLDPDVAVTGASYDGAVDQTSVLRRAIGRRLIFRSGKDTVSAEVLGVDPERYKLPNGMITFQAPGVPQFPADLVVVEPLVRLGVVSGTARKELKLAWFTAGASWQASYQVLLGAETARVTGQAVVSAGALRVSDAEVQLLAGAVSRGAAADEGRPRPMAAMVREEVAKVTEQKVGEFHLYTLPGRLSLDPGVTVTAALFTPAPARYTRTFEARGEIPYWGGLPPEGGEVEMPVRVTYTVQRPRKSEFGDRPLPAGVVRLFEPDSAGRLQLVGESTIDHTPAGEDLRLAAGTAFDLSARRVQTSYATRRDSVAAGPWRTVATADYRVTLRNAGDSKVAVDVIEERAGEWTVVSSSVKPEKVSATRTRFRVPVPAKGSATLTYRVRVAW